MSRPLSEMLPIENLLNAQGIRYLLKQVTHQREHVELALPDGENSQVFVVPESVTVQRFELQTLLVPAPSMHTLQAGDSIALHGRLNGAAFHFSTELEAIELRPQEGQLTCRMPESGELHERRASPRFTVPNTGPRTVAVVHVPGEIMLCEVVNISREGVRLRLDAPNVELGEEKVVYCEIRRGDHLLQSKIEVRWKQEFDGEHQEFGARFLARDPTSGNRINQFVAELERYWVRLRA